MLPFTDPAATPAEPGGLTPRAPRALTLLLVGRIAGPHGDGLCRIRNISDSGLMAEVAMPLAIEEQIRIELRNGRVVTGDVRWRQENRIGVRFNRPIDDVAAFLAMPPTMQDGTVPVARSLVMDTNCSADVQIDGHHHAGTMVTISQTGARVAVRAALRPEQALSISVTGLPLLRAVTRWDGADLADVTFIDPLKFDVLAPWLADAALRFNRRD